MESFEHVVVGSGPAGVAAARRLDGRGACIVDGGDTPAGPFPHATLDAALEAGDAASLLGDRWETLANLVEAGTVHAKLKGPLLRHLERGVPYRVVDAAGGTVLRGAGSLAAGGLSNGWGGQLFRYTAEDLAEAGDWPVTVDELAPHFDDLEEHIGISGERDSLAPFLGESRSLLPPTPLVPAARRLLDAYARRGPSSGIRLGRSRLAVLTRPHRGYVPCDFGETGFFNPEQPGVYTARRTLGELVAGGRTAYLGRHLLLGWKEGPEEVELALLDRDRGTPRTVRTRHLLLACGAVQTARLVLLHGGERGRSLPFMDHPPTLLPFFLPPLFGTPLPGRSFPVQLAGTLEGAGRRDMISFYYPGGMLRSEFLPDVPVPMGEGARILGSLLGGMLVAQVWELSRPAPGNRLSLEEDGSVRIDYPVRPSWGGLGRLVAALRPLGGWTLGRLASSVVPGWGFHHAGSLPMRRDPGPYETHPDGRLWNSRRVRAADGSVLPSLPAKNHSLAMMANAARIADGAARCGY